MTVGLRERKKAMTRGALQAAALELFAEKGFEGTTVEEIADACDISPRTFFRYFATKEDVLFGDGDDSRVALVETIRQRPLHEPMLRSVRAGILGVAADYENDRDRLLAKADILARHPNLRTRSIERQRDWETAVTEVLQERAAAGTPTSAFELRLIAAVGTAALRASCDTWLAEGGELGVLVTEAFDRLATGLAPKRRPQPVG